MTPEHEEPAGLSSTGSLSPLQDPPALDLGHAAVKARREAPVGHSEVTSAKADKEQEKLKRKELSARLEAQRVELLELERIDELYVKEQERQGGRGAMWEAPNSQKVELTRRAREKQRLMNSLGMNSKVTPVSTPVKAVATPGRRNSAS